MNFLISICLVANTCIFSPVPDSNLVLVHPILSENPPTSIYAMTFLYDMVEIGNKTVYIGATRNTPY